MRHHCQAFILCTPWL